jgi:hypothetical protein
MLQDQQSIQQLRRDRRHHEKVDRSHAVGMIVKKCLPALPMGIGLGEDRFELLRGGSRHFLRLLPGLEGVTAATRRSSALGLILIKLHPAIWSPPIPAKTSDRASDISANTRRSSGCKSFDFLAKILDRRRADALRARQKIRGF